MPLAPVPPKPVRPEPSVGSLAFRAAFFWLIGGPKEGAGGALREGGALELLRFGGALEDFDFDLLAILFFLSVAPLWLLCD